MQEKILSEWNQPDYIQVSVETYSQMKKKINAYEITIDAIKEVLYGKKFPEFVYEDDLEEIKGILRSLENEINSL